MATQGELQAALVALFIKPLPVSVQNNLLQDPEFCAKLGILPRFVCSLDREHTAYSDSLHGALRKAVNGEKSTSLELKGGTRELVKLGRRGDGTATLTITGREFAFSNADLLAASRKSRIAAIERVTSATPLLPYEEEKWRAVAERGPLTDAEYVEFTTALSATPEAVHGELQQCQEFDASKLIPSEVHYYQRLVAPLESAVSLDAFIRGELDSSRRSLLERHRARTLRRMGFTALWQPLIPFDLLGSATISDVSPLLNSEDPFSLLFGFELCRDRLSADTGFSALGMAFLEKLLLDEKSVSNRCNIFSALALISSVKLRHAASASDAPLFWIRLAALTHAGVLTDALSDLSESERFLQWARESFYPTYFWHSVIDRRDAPQWKPDWINPDQLYAELVGRVLIAVHLIPEENRPSQWMSAIDGALARLEKSGNALGVRFPGPFDDFREKSALPTNAVFDEVEACLDGASSLNAVPGLFALAYITQPSPRVVGNVIRIVNQTTDLPIVTDEQQMPFLRLSAHIAASSRSEPLAQALINRCLVEVRALETKANPIELFVVMAEACAAQPDPQKHGELLGAAATKICFAVENDEDLSNLEAVFDLLVMRDERLIPALARARAIARTKRGRSYGSGN